MTFPPHDLGSPFMRPSGQDVNDACLDHPPYDLEAYPGLLARTDSGENDEAAAPETAEDTRRAWSPDITGGCAMLDNLHPGMA